MKKPRIADFDPDNQPPTLGSPLDDMPVIAAPVVRAAGPVELQPDVPATVATPTEPVKRPPVRPSDLPTARTPVRRTLTRYAFEFFQDQVASLKRLSLQDKLAGGKGSMSEMVREALDQYLAQRRGGGD